MVEGRNVQSAEIVRVSRKWMFNMVRTFFHWCRFAVLGLLASTAACAGFHSAQAIRGQVVDKDTGQPLEGVIVVAQWQPDFVGTFGRREGSVINSFEAVTDKEGRYQIPAWGPKPLLPFTEMGIEDPGLSFFKPGFMPFFASNTAFADPRQRRVPLGVSEWDGKIVTLSKHYGPLKQYAERVGLLSRSLRDARDNWKNYPRMVYALWREEKRLPKGILRPFGQLAPIDIEILSEDDRKYLEERGR